MASEKVIFCETIARWYPGFAPLTNLDWYAKAETDEIVQLMVIHKYCKLNDDGTFQIPKSLTNKCMERVKPEGVGTVLSVWDRRGPQRFGDSIRIGSILFAGSTKKDMDRVNRVFVRCVVTQVYFPYLILFILIVF